MSPFSLAPSADAPIVKAALDANVDPAFAQDVLRGLGARRKTIPCTWLYDHRGSELFEAITELDEYYLTRTETALLQRHVNALATAIGPAANIVEIGSGSSRKTRMLLGALEQPATYVPVDISETFLFESIAQLGQDFPDIAMHPVVADFTKPFRLPPEVVARSSTSKQSRNVGFFPGSTIGNFDPENALALLGNMAQLLGPNALMIIGADATRQAEILIPAYDDAAQVTAQFNLNLLTRINRELHGNFDLAAFQHEARYNQQLGRVEMHLVSRVQQSAEVLGQRFHFSAGETIHTESSYKYGQAEFLAMAQLSGWQYAEHWSDPEGRYFMHLLHCPPNSSDV